MATISDLSHDLVEEILYKLPITSLGAVRSTSNEWNHLSKNDILCKTETKQQFIGFLTKEHRLCSMRFSLHGDLSEESEEFVDPFIKEVRHFFNQAEISKVFHCDGLLLCCVTKEDRVVVWNPYLGQTKWIEPIKSYQISDITYALGYVDDKKKRNHRILRFFNHFQFVKNVYGYEIFDFESNSWKVLDIRRSFWNIRFHPYGVPLKGNAYFLAKGQNVYLVCFDFARERFGPFHSLPFHSHPLHSVTLSCVREEQLAVLFEPLKLPVIEIWVTTKIDEPNPIRWKKFLKVDISGLRLHSFGCFFIDQEKKVAVVFERSIAHIIGEKGCLRKVDIGEPANLGVLRYCRSLVCSYVPSVVQIN